MRFQKIASIWFNGVSFVSGIKPRRTYSGNPRPASLAVQSDPASWIPECSIAKRNICRNLPGEPQPAAPPMSTCPQVVQLKDELEPIPAQCDFSHQGTEAPSFCSDDPRHRELGLPHQQPLDRCGFHSSWRLERSGRVGYGSKKNRQSIGTGFSMRTKKKTLVPAASLRDPP